MNGLFWEKKIQIYQQHPYVDYILNILANSLNKFKLKKKKKKTTTTTATATTTKLSKLVGWIPIRQTR